jgi:hypothetical protein
VKVASATVVCYCFDVTVGAIRDELRRTGQPGVIARITEEIRAGNCDCAARNPSGKCCLGDVHRVVHELSAG